MRAKGSEQFNPSRAWAVAEGFLAAHGVSPDGLPVSPNVVKVLMVGVWAGCRFALLDREFALGIATAGNDRPELVFATLRLALAAEFQESVQQVLAEVLRQRGFTNAEMPSPPSPEPGPAPLSGDEAIEAAEELLRDLTEPGEEGEDRR